MNRTIITGGLVLRGPATTGDFAEVDLLIKDGRIGRIEPGIAVDDAEVIDATGMARETGLSHNTVKKYLKRFDAAG